MPLTRSSELLNVVDGLFFIDQDIIDLAARFYSELKSTAATLGDGAIERLVPHVISLMNKLDCMCKENKLLKQQNELLTEDLASLEHRCVDLNKSYKEVSRECCEIETQCSDIETRCEADVRKLSDELAKCKEDNVRLQQEISSNNHTSDPSRLLVESEEKVATLTAERICLLTTIEVLEADMRCLRAELRSLESQERRRRPSAAAADASISELSAVNISSNQQPSLPISTSKGPTPLSHDHSAMDFDTSSEFKDVLLIGDSHLRYSCNKSAFKGAHVECCPGAKILDIKNKLLGYLDLRPSVILFHVGCNNLRRGYSGGPGYNGGHGKREALHNMADLLFTAKRNFPNSKIFVNSILIRRDIGNKALHDFNDQLDLMCNNFGVEFVEVNRCVGRRDLARDGVHLNRKGVSRLGSLIVNVISTALQCLDVEKPPSLSDSVGAAPALSSGPGNGDVAVSGRGSHDGSVAPHVSGNWLGGGETNVFTSPI